MKRIGIQKRGLGEKGEREEGEVYIHRGIIRKRKRDHKRKKDEKKRVWKGEKDFEKG